ncbi:MAG: flavodoxin family protein [Candidatus Bathyarchaeota archaeon]|nr:flavodoxin family protein [Candidatus Bathyarchaeota archaeon]
MRQGNSDWMLNTLLEAAMLEEAEVDKVYLRDFEKRQNLKQCTGCDACVTTGECAIKDGMQKIYPKLLEAQVIVVATPNYFKNVNGLTKLFIDRTNALLRKDNVRRLKKKYAIGLLVGGEELEDTQYCEDALNRFFKGHKMVTLRMIKARADEVGKVQKIKGLEAELVKVGKGVVKGDSEIMDAVLFEHNP